MVTISKQIKTHHLLVHGFAAVITLIGFSCVLSTQAHAMQPEILDLSAGLIESFDVDEHDSYEFDDAESIHESFEDENCSEEDVICIDVQRATKSISKATVTGIIDRHYTGKALKQSFAVKLNRNKLKLNRDYKVSYKNNVKVGKAYVIIKGKGAYTGTKKVSFIIHKPSYKTCLSCIKSAVAAHKSVVEFPRNTVLYSDYQKIVRRLYSSSDPESPIFMDRNGLDSFGYPRTKWSDDYHAAVIVGVRLNYTLNKTQPTIVKNKVKAVAKQAKENGGTSSVIRYIHDYLVKQTAYKTAAAIWPTTTEALADSSYGVLIKHRGSCYGYTVSFVRLLQAAGVKDARVVECTSPGSSYYNDHVVCRVGSRYYDVTWDDALDPWWQDYGPYAAPDHTYFGKTKSQMQQLGYIF